MNFFSNSFLISIEENIIIRYCTEVRWMGWRPDEVKIIFHHHHHHMDLCYSVLLFIISWNIRKIKRNHTMMIRQFSHFYYNFTSSPVYPPPRLLRTSWHSYLRSWHGIWNGLYHQENEKWLAWDGMLFMGCFQPRLRFLSFPSAVIENIRWFLILFEEIFSSRFLWCCRWDEHHLPPLECSFVWRALFQIDDASPLSPFIWLPNLGRQTKQNRKQNRKEKEFSISYFHRFPFPAFCNKLYAAIVYAYEHMNVHCT